MADIGQVADHFSAEVDRFNSLGLWTQRDRKVVTEAAEALIAGFASARVEEQRVLRSRLSYRTRDVLLSYASELALSALRLDSPDLVTKGLTALALVDEGNDIRDSIVTLDELHNTARKLKMNPKVFLEAARSMNNGQLRRRFIEFAWGQEAKD